MKKILFNIIILAFSANLYAQMHCGSELNLSELQQTDLVRFQRIMELENQIYTMLRSNNSIPQSTIIIPVIVHIVHNTASQNVTPRSA